MQQVKDKPNPQIEELFYIRFNNTIDGFDFLTFPDPLKAKASPKDSLENTALIVLDEEMNWKVIGFRKQLKPQPVQSSDIITLLEFTDCTKYATILQEVTNNPYQFNPEIIDLFFLSHFNYLIITIPL